MRKLAGTFLGEPCGRGHDGLRYSSQGMCVGCSKEWYAKNNEKKDAEYFETKEKIKERKSARARQYYLENKEKILLQQKQYYEANKENWSEKRHKRRAGGEPTYVKVEDIQKLKSLQQNKCPVCKCELVKHHLDHIVPISKGGKHEFDNLQLLCPTCNLNKHAKDPLDFMRTKGYLL